jgi:acyl-coenzyme A synthetase/AMP-(fatty) acid ligase
MTAVLPLIGRDDDDVMFWRFGTPVRAAQFLRDVHRVAADLPPCRHVCNLCQDRYAFTVTFAAAALRGQVSLLTSDRSASSLGTLCDSFDDIISASDAEATPRMLRHHAVTLHADRVADGGDNPDLPTDRVVAVVFTSGSTGAPVGYTKSWGALTERSRDAAARFAIADDGLTAIVGTVPPQHMYGFETTVLLPLHTASASWSGHTFYPSDIRDALQAVPARRILVTTPLQLRALADSKTALPALQSIISATAPLDATLAAAAEAAWNVPVLEIFGATEVGSIASRRTLDGPTWTMYDQVRFDPIDVSGQGTVTAPFSVPHMLADIVELVSPTEFRLIGRAADVVKVGGRRASLAGLNKILLDIPGVIDGMFIAPENPGASPTSRLQAVVVAPELSIEDIITALRARMDAVFLPRRIIRATALPRNDTGKVTQAALAQLLEHNDAAR